MKKIILCAVLACLSSVTLASSRVQLPVNQPIVAPQASSEVSLATLKQSVIYNILCTVASDSDDTYLKLIPSTFNPVLTMAFVANGNPVNSQMIVLKGDNVLEVLNFGYFDNGMGTSPSLTIENLDNDATLTIKQCYAIPTTNARK